MLRHRLLLATLGLSLSATAMAAAPAWPEHPPMHARFGPGPAFAADQGVLQTLSELQRLYVQAGRRSELPALYNAVLNQTHDPRLRREVYRRLAMAQLQPSHVDAAIATLRRSLDESLAAQAAEQAAPPAAP